MKIRRWILVVVSGATLVLLPTALLSSNAPTRPKTAAALADDSRPGGPENGGEGDHRPPSEPERRPIFGKSLCKPGTPPNAPPTTQYFNGNPLLGPDQLPTAPPVGPLLSGYQRFGGLANADDFLAQYANPARDAYVFPPALGFALGPNGVPIKTAQELLPGYRLDRFGFPGGSFLSPLGTPFSSRALPPSSLNTPQSAPLANYHVYCVVKPFTVDSGPIAPWFAQPGMGTQYKLERKYLPEAGTSLNVTWLLNNGYLVEEDIVRTPPLCPGAGKISSDPAAIPGDKPDAEIEDGLGAGGGGDC